MSADAVLRRALPPGAAPAAAGEIPVLLPGAGDEHRRSQARFFDEVVDPEYEITRPHGAAAFHAWLLGEKFRRATAGLAGVTFATALTVCGGSGMDAEYLARRGASVVTCDISAGAARRAAERARRYGLDIRSVVADAERLPFVDRSFDLVYVHDGLHHLDDPWAALREMARIASRCVSVSEPAEAALTAAAVRLGLAQEEEAAGNRVRRLRVGDVARELQARGFVVTRAERYAMLYRHEAGPLTRFVSGPALLRSRGPPRGVRTRCSAGSATS